MMLDLPLPSDMKVLVVDDVRDNLLAIEAALTGLSTEVVLAASGAEALRYLLDNDVALILLDVRMPTMGGIETARMIRQRPRSRHVPIIFLTAHGRDDDEVLEAYRLGAVDFLFKPIRIDELKAKAAVFVELQRRTAEIARQNRVIKQHEQEERQRALADQRRQLEAEALRKSLREQRAHAEELAIKNVELETVRAQLEQSNQRLADADLRKDEFIAVLAHELRNPMAALLAGLELLEGEPDSSQRGVVLPVMRRQSEHLMRLVDDLLDISRITCGKIKLHKQLLAIGDVLDSAVKLAMPRIEERKHELDVQVECGDALVNGDSVRLAQVIANLLNNAARYSPHGSPIRLIARRDPPEHLCIIVEDEGQGMSEDLVGQVFDLFVQAENGGGGLGVGLTLVRQLTELHGGEAIAFSEGQGHGSRFEIRLPEAHGQGVPTSDQAPSVSREVSRRVALIDDHSDVLSMTRAVLENWGHSVVVADTGTAGVELILRERPDLAIVDIGLPDIEGYEVARRVRAELGDQCPRLIAMTGYGQRRDRERAMEAGFDAHLRKPTSAEALRAAIHGAAD